MKLKLSLCLVSAAMLMISCSRPGIVANSKVTIQSPLKSVSITSYSDTSSFSTVRDPRFLQICFDTVLVVQQTVHTEGDLHFKAFSTVTSDSLGSFFHNGRGPGEMSSPHMEKTHSGDNCLGIVENGTGTLPSIASLHWPGGCQGMPILPSTSSTGRVISCMNSRLMNPCLT